MDHKHLTSPAGDSRENSVPCAKCGINSRTWNICGQCDSHCDCTDAR